MRHNEKTKALEAYHKKMQQRLKEHGAKALPPSVKVDKLEEAYDRLQNYVYRLVPKNAKHVHQ